CGTGYTDQGTDFLGTNDDVWAVDLFGKVNYRNFTFSGGYRPNKTDVPSVGGIPTPTSFIKRDDSFGHVQYLKELNEKWHFFSQVYFQNELVFLNDPLGALDVADLRVEGEARANYHWNERNDVTMGTEWRRDRTNDEKSTGTETFHGTNRSFYAEDQFHL